MTANEVPDAPGRTWAGQPPASLSGLVGIDWLYRLFRQYYVPFLPATRDAPILDFGCGFGPFFGFVSRLGYRDVLGVDVDLPSVEFCRAHVTESVQHVTDSCLWLQTQQNKYDLIVMRGVICYFTPDSLHECLLASRAALRPGGRLLVEIFNGALLTGPYPQYNDHYIIRIFTEHSLRLALENAGFQVVTLVGVSAKRHTVKHRVWRAG